VENLRRIRKEKGLTMKQLGAMTDVSESMIQMVETGTRKPSFELLLKLGEALDCSVNDLLDTKKEPANDVDGSKQEDVVVTDKDLRFLTWFRSLSPEKQKAILISQDAPEDLF